MNDRKNPLGYGIIGVGIWGELHTRVINDSPYANVMAICDLNEKRAREVAQKYNIPSVYTRYEDMLNDPKIEAVSVATPDFAHGAPALAAVKAGKHLLIEKPMATTVEESVEIIQAAKKAGVTLMVDFHNRWSPPFADAFNSIRQGDLGNLEFIYFRLSDTIYVATSYISWAGKSSALWFLGPHSIDTVRWLFQDEVREVFAVSRSGTLTGKGITTPDFYTGLVQFEKGGVASIENSWIVSTSSPNIFDLKCEMQGSKGTVFVDTSHNNLYQKYTEQTPQGYPFHPHQDFMLMPIVHDQQVGFATESIRHFLDCVYHGKQPMVSGVDGLRTTEILVAMEESAKTNKPVHVKRTQM